jgi:type II secretory pathway pseudopilin PulG
VSNRRALTLIEVLVVLLITTIIAGIMIPVLSSAKGGAHIVDSQSRLRQLYVALELYRQQHDGGGSSYQYHAQGLAPNSYRWETGFGVEESFWRSPCGSDLTVFTSAGFGKRGEIFYAAPKYDPANISTTTNTIYKQYLEEYRDNAVVFLDHYCNPVGTRMNSPLIRKRGLAVLLSGQLKRVFRSGDASTLQFYSDPP